MGLLAGDRPSADVEVLAGAFAVVEYELARRMHAATTAGSLPLVGPGAVLAARGWASPQARRLARTGALAAEHPTLAGAWAAGIITSEHVDAVARNIGPLTEDELAAVIAELGTRWGQWSPPMITRFVLSAIRLLHPPTDDRPGRRRGRRARQPGPVLRPARRHRHPVRDPAPPRGRGGDRRHRRPGRTAAQHRRPRPRRSPTRRRPGRAGQHRRHRGRPADPRRAARRPDRHPGAHPARGPGLDHQPRPPPHPRRAAVHRLRPHHHPHRGHHPRTANPRGVDRPRAHCPDTLEGLFDPEGAAPMAGAAPDATRRWIRAHNRRPRPRPGSRPWPRCSSTDPGSRWPSDAPPGPPPPPNARPWPPATADASSPDARSRPRTARPTTSTTGPPAVLRTSTTSPCSAGPTTARSTSACGPSTPPNPGPQSPNRPRGHPREHPGPATTERPGPSAPSTAPAGDCERRGPEPTRRRELIAAGQTPMCG